MSQNTSHAVMAQRAEPADSFDLFPTPPWATRALCECLAPQFDLRRRRAWEPACGLGHMTRPLSEYFELVYGSDVVDYGTGAQRDFLFPGDEPAFDWIITNPPFKLAEEFAHTAIDRATEGVALLVRIAFLESVGRYAKLFAKRPPRTILQFTERVPMHKGRLVENGSTATAYCWLIWLCRPHHPTPSDSTSFCWIPPCRRSLERAGDYDEPVALVRGAAHG
jgi:hypothetical protein